MNKLFYAPLSFLLLGISGCDRSTVEAAAPPAKVFAGVQTNVQTGVPKGEAARLESVALLTPGTTVRVRLQESLDTRRNRAGDRFSATLDGPLVVNGRVAVPRGTPFEGHVVRSSESGRFKGRAALALRLDSFKLNGVTYDVNTSRPVSVSKGHKKRNWRWSGCRDRRGSRRSGWHRGRCLYRETTCGFTGGIACHVHSPVGRSRRNL